MKTILKLSLFLILPFIGAMIFYLPTAFTMMEMNPFKWEESTRALVGIEGMFLILVGIGVAISINKDLFKD